MTQHMEHIIMARVHRIHTLRRLLGARALKAYTLVLCVCGLLSTVSVVSVFTNLSAVAGPYALGRFMVDAFMSTEAVVNLLVLGIVLSVVMLVRDVAKSSVHAGRMLSRV